MRLSLPTPVRCTALALGFALSGAAAQAGDGRDLDTVAEGGWSAHSMRAYYVITREEDWEKLWEEIHAGVFVSPVPPLPEVDFATRTVIAVFQGTRPTGGFSIRVRRVVQAGEAAVVVVRELSPGPDCGVTLAVTRPFHVVSVPKLDGAVSFRVNPQTVRCD